MMLGVQGGGKTKRESIREGECDDRRPDIRQTEDWTRCVRACVRVCVCRRCYQGRWGPDTPSWEVLRHTSLLYSALLLGDQEYSLGA